MRPTSLFLLFFLSLLCYSSSVQEPLCHEDDHYSLLQFKQSLLFDNFACDPSNYTKLKTWRSSDCCSWDGVNCNFGTGHVIGLDLSSSCLLGSINSTSSIFRLFHVKTLNLAYNNFNLSRIPPGIKSLSGLTHLNLSNTNLSGKIPSEILQLSELVSLDLGDNPLQLQQPSLKDVVDSFSKLAELRLSGITISSQVPRSLANFTSLSSLLLRNCSLQGEFPSGIFQLPNLHLLSLRNNPNLRGYLPEFQVGSPLEMLRLVNTKLSGQLPFSIGNLKFLSEFTVSGCHFWGQIPTSIVNLTKLEVLDLSENNFSGQLPSSIGNLKFLNDFEARGCNFWGQIPTSIGNLTKLEVLDLSENNFSGQLPSSIGNLKSLNDFEVRGCNFWGQIPTSIGNLTKLETLDLSNNSFSGNIPSSIINLLQLTYLSLSFNNFSSHTPYWLSKLTNLHDLYMVKTNSYGDVLSSLGNLTQIQSLYLYANQFTGQIPYSLGNFTQLVTLELSDNGFQGPIPEPIFRLPNLQVLHLMSNNLSGTLTFDSFRQSKTLSKLGLSFNHLSLVSGSSINATLPKFQWVQLSACNMTEFPSFLQSQNKLEVLLLAENRIEGLIPNWMSNMATESLLYLDLAFNFLTGFEQSFVVLPWTNLVKLDLDFNNLQGALPIPPPSIASYIVSRNKFSAYISPLFCKLTSVLTVDLSNNNLSGNLPPCLWNLVSFASILDLSNNSLTGKIPDKFTSSCNIKAMDFCQNKLEGKVPRSLSNCSKLEILKLGENQIQDSFPSWLGILPRLRVLTLRSNRFHGAIGKPLNKFEFNLLQIIDLSYNNFTGKLPSEYFRNWIGMKSVDNSHLAYMEANSSFSSHNMGWRDHYAYSIKIMNKGRDTIYDKILEFFVAVDLSSNRFEGEIPEVIGDLNEVQLLNLSDNILSGHIPLSLVKLKEVEALDLSHNKLSGHIPMQLAKLTFLSFFNVSHNNLTGPIPQSYQFQTFPNYSFSANPGLCGSPLSKKCGVNLSIPLEPLENQDSGIPFELNWKVVVMGYGCGLVIGIVIGWTVSIKKHQWLLKKFA